MSDHYQVLGVDRDATQELISAAYRALIKAFHPDVFKGDRDFAEARTKALNAAYAVLCDPIKRRDYDLETSVGQKSEPEDSDDWARACQFFPEISSMNLELCRVSAELGNRFRESLLSSKEFNNAERVQDSLLHQFAVDKFGRNELLQITGLTALRMGRRRLALAINQACHIIGDNEPAVILRRLGFEHGEEARAVYQACNLEHFLPQKAKISIRPGLYRVKERFRFRVLPDTSIVIFYENGQELSDYKHVPDLDSFLIDHQVNLGEVESSESDIYE